MCTTPLGRLLAPRSVAAIGVSDRPGSVGATLARNLLQGGFAGPVWFVNEKRRSVAGRPCVQRVAQLPGVPDLAVLCTPAASIPGLVDELGTLGCRAVLVITAGLDATPTAEGGTAAAAALAAARRHGLRLLGPNCVGLLVPGIGLNASFAHASTRPGPLAFVGQSGALTTALLDWSAQQDIGFSHFVSLGNTLDLSFAELLEHLAADEGTKAILLYMESLRDGAAFLRAAAAATAVKPVLVVKSGRGAEGQRAAASHTGALAGSDAVYEAAFRRCGVLRVDSTRELFDAAEVLARCRPVRGRRLAIVTNGGGPAILATDALVGRGGQLSRLSPDTLQTLDAVLPPLWSRGNPVDIVGDAPPERYAAALSAVLADPAADAVLLMHAPTAIVSATRIAEVCLPLLRDSSRPVLTCWMGGDAVAEARRLSLAAGLPSLHTPEEAVEGFLLAARRDAVRAAPAEGKGLLGPAVGRQLRELLQPDLAAGGWLAPQRVAQLLDLVGLPRIASFELPDADAVVATAARQPGTLQWVLKLRSPDVLHKSDVGGVCTGLRLDELEAAARRMQDALRHHLPGARLEGFTLQPQLDLAAWQELLVGLSHDAIFGPVLVFAAGGVAVEVLADRAVDLVPVDESGATALVARTRVSRLLQGYRNRPAADHAALCRAIRIVSELCQWLPELRELDLNPLCAGPQGVVVLDARLRLAAPAAAT